MDESVDIRARLHGAGAVRSEARGMSDSITRIGSAARTASHGLGALTGAAGNFGRTITSWRSAAVIGTIGYATKSLVGMGLQFNATMEQNQVSFGQFLGSAQAARHELSFLYKVAAKTPFEVPQITAAAQGLLGVGLSARQANSWLMTIGDTIAGIGGGAGEMDSLVRAIGQIKSKGVLQGDELMQLSELRVLNRGRLAKDLGITPLALMSGNANVSSGRALKALQKQFDATFGGQAARQAQTFNGQLSTLHDNLNMTLGKASVPIFNRLEKEVFPGAEKALGDFNSALDRKDLSMSDRLNLGWSRARHDLTPMVDGIERDLKAAHLDDRFADVIDWAAPRMGEAAGRAGVIALKSFGNTWLHGDFLTKAVLTWFAGSKLGVWRRAGDLAFDAFSSSWGRGRGGAPVPGGRGGARGGGRGGGFSGLPLFAVGKGPLGVLIAHWIAKDILHSHNADPLDFLNPEAAGWSTATERRHLGAMRRTHRVDPAVAYFRHHRGELSPEVISTLTRPQLIQLHLDGKVVARHTVKHADDARARKDR